MWLFVLIIWPTFILQKRYKQALRRSEDAMDMVEKSLGKEHPLYKSIKGRYETLKEKNSKKDEEKKD